MAGRDFLEEEPSGRDFLEESAPQESFGQSALYAPFRAFQDIGKKTYQGIQNLPNRYEQYKTELPGFWQNIVKHPEHMALQGLAGANELINAINQTPVNLAKYGSERLHLLPQGAESFARKFVPEDTTQAINQLFGQPQYPGEALFRGTVRNFPSIKGISALGSQASKLSPSNILRGNLTPEELEHNLRITQGTQTGLGDVIGSPFLKRLNENILSKIPGSGVNNALQKTGSEIINRGHNILEALAPEGEVENLDKYLNDALKDAYKFHQSKKNSLYKNANEIANQIGLNLDLPNFANQAKQYKNAIQDTSILKYEPELQRLVSKLANFEEPVKSIETTGALIDTYGNPLLKETTTTKPTLEEANLLKGRLNQLASQHGASPNPSDRHLAGVFGKLAGTLKSDIQDAIQNSNHGGLKKLYEEAEKNYGKNFSPFLDKQIYKFINGNADADTLISSFIKTGKSNDRANLISKVIDRLPQEDKHLLGYGYLQRALDENGVLNPLKLKTLISKNALGQRQFEALFPNPVIRNALRDYSDLVNMNTKALKLMQNPETGQMNMDLLPLLSSSPTNFLLKLTGAPLAGKLLRSEKTRTKLVKKITNKK
jgi:hypothetical protein